MRHNEWVVTCDRCHRRQVLQGMLSAILVGDILRRWGWTCNSRDYCPECSGEGAGR